MAFMVRNVIGRLRRMRARWRSVLHPDPDRDRRRAQLLFISNAAKQGYSLDEIGTMLVRDDARDGREGT